MLQKLILSRPYSWIGIVLVALLANVIATKNFIINIDMFVDIITAFLMWCFTLFIAEFIHRKVDKRGYKSPLLPILILIAVAIIFLYKNFLTLPILLVVLVANIIYSFKIKKWLLSAFSFMFRGILEVSIFIVVLFFHSFYSLNDILPLILAIYLLVDSRNLIGDIRDVDFDQYTFPRRYGINVSYVVSALLAIISLIIILNVMIVFPIIIFLFLLIKTRNSYLLHRIYVIVTTFFIMNYILFLLNYNIIFSNVLFIAVILNFTYPLVPRKSNPVKAPSF